MDLLQLEHFLAVAVEGTFTRAAERVLRTQPALSQSIKKLETDLEATLFVRESNVVYLTEAGRLLEKYAHRMLNLRDEAKRSVAQLQSLKAGTLTVAAHESAELYLLPAAILRFMQILPDIRISIRRARLEEIPGLVLDREVHIGFVKEAPAFQELESVDVHSDRMALIAAPKHPLAARKTVSVKDLDGAPFVVHRSCSSTEQLVLRLFRQNGIQCHVVTELCSFENMKRFVVGNVGLAIVPRITVMEELAAGSLIEIGMPELNFHRGTVMTYRRDYISDPASCLIGIMRSKYVHAQARMSKQTAVPSIARLQPYERVQESA